MADRIVGSLPLRRFNPERIVAGPQSEIRHAGVRFDCPNCGDVSEDQRHKITLLSDAECAEAARAPVFMIEGSTWESLSVDRAFKTRCGLTLKIQRGRLVWG